MRTGRMQLWSLLCLNFIADSDPFCLGLGHVLNLLNMSCLSCLTCKIRVRIFTMSVCLKDEIKIPCKVLMLSLEFLNH